MQKNGNHNTHHRLTSVSVIGGFLDGAEFRLEDGLNCFIGARGAGKTTVLEMIRYAMNVMPEAPAERRRVEALLKANLGNGRIQLALTTKDGAELLVHRSVGEQPLVLTRDGKPTQIAVDHMFRVDVYSQNEVERIATDPQAQLAIIDRFQLTKTADVQRRIREVSAQLAANRAKLAPLLEQSAELARDLERLPAVETRLESLGEVGGPNRETINEAHRQKACRERQERRLLDLDGSLAGLAERVGELLAALDEAQPPAPLPADANAPILAEGDALLGECLRDAARGLTQVVERLGAGRKLLQPLGARLALAHKSQELQFRELIERHRDAQALVVERVAAERERNGLLAIQSQRLTLARQIEHLETARLSLLERLSELWDERYFLRREIVDQINDQLGERIRVQLVQLRQVALYREFLEVRLASSSLKRKQAAERLTTMAPRELARALRDADQARLVEMAGVSAEQAAKVLESLGDWATILELEEAQLDDGAVITLRDGEAYKPTEELSTGQKCTAVLPILLLESDAPLLVDQPEDNIDNGFISSTIVESIRKVRRRRQLVFVTHNPNIPVLGEADCVFVLHSDGERAQAANTGSVDDCKADIVRLLEGGESAFKARKRRYAY